MKRFPKITIITVSYNQAEFLEQAMLSVLKQGYPNLEYIVVDGGSSDGSLQIIEKYADCLAWWVSEPDSGQSEALNKGMSHSTGDIVGWLNSDDTFDADLFVSVAKVFEDEDIHIAMSKHHGVIDSDGVRFKSHRNDYINRDRLIKFWLTNGMTINQPCVFFRRNLLARETYFVDTGLNYAMDYDFWLRITKYASISVFQGSWANYRMHDYNKSTIEVANFWPEWLTVSKRHWGRKFGKKWLNYFISYNMHMVLRGRPPQKPFFASP